MGSSEIDFAPEAGGAQNVALSVGSKMLFWTSALLLASFGVCSMLTLSLARHMVKTDLEIKVPRESTFLAQASAESLQQGAAVDYNRLAQLCQRLSDEPEILGVQVIDRHRRVLASSGAMRLSNFFVQVPIVGSARQVLGFVKAWYSPVRVLQDYWSSTGHLVTLLFIATFALFSVVLFGIVENLLNRPFRRFIRLLEDVPGKAQFPPAVTNRRDEWGLLGRRLNRYLAHLSNLHERSSVLYETARLMSEPDGLRRSLDAVFTGLQYRYRLASCLLFARAGDELVVEASAGVSADFAKSLRLKAGEGWIGTAFASGQLRHLPSVEESGDPLLQEFLKRQPIGAALFVPMRADERVTGVAVYLGQPQHALGEAQIEALAAFTDHVSLAFRTAGRLSTLQASQARLESELETAVRELHHTNARLIRKVRELKTIYDLALSTAASTNANDVAQVMIRGVKELVDVQKAGLFLLRDAVLEPVGSAFDMPGAPSALSVAIDESELIRRTLVDEKVQVVNFVDASEPIPRAWKNLGIRSLLALPLKQAGEVRGIFCAVNKVNGLFNEDDTRLLFLLTNRVAEVLHRLTLDDQLRQQVYDLKVLQDIAANLPSPPLLADTVKAIGKVARAALPGTDLCLFYLYAQESETLVPAGGDWEASLIPDLKMFEHAEASRPSPAIDVFRSGKPLEFRRPGPAEILAMAGVDPQISFSELLYLPLIVQQRTIGVMALGRRESPLGAQERRLIGLVAGQVAIMLERSRLYERLVATNEKLEQINHLKNEFITMVSHELRTPLTTIKGFVSIVLHEETGAINNDQRHFLTTADRAIDRLALLISDLLDISRIEAGKIKMQVRSTSLKDIIRQVAHNFEPQFKSRALSLTLNTPEALPNVLADAHRITQVLDNLLSNALKFTRTGGVTITCVDKGDFVLTSVRDTGSGISKEEQNKIFEKFYQIKIGGTFPENGTGLGLAIVRSIVESHRGRVWVESELGKGAEFRFLLPRPRLENEPPLDHPTPA